MKIWLHDEQCMVLLQDLKKKKKSLSKHHLRWTVYSFAAEFLVFTTLIPKAVENNAGKGENTGYLHFLYFKRLCPSYEKELSSFEALFFFFIFFRLQMFSNSMLSIGKERLAESFLFQKRNIVDTFKVNRQIFNPTAIIIDQG